MNRPSLFNLIMAAFSNLEEALSGFDTTAARTHAVGYGNSNGHSSEGLLDWGPSDVASSDSSMVEPFGHEATGDSFDINPATGMLMVGGIGGMDVAGNPYGTGGMLGSFDDPFSTGTVGASGIHESFGMSDPFSSFDTCSTFDTFDHSDPCSGMSSFDSFGSGSFGGDW